MKKYIKDIILSVLGIGFEVIRTIGVAVFTTICVVLEFAASCTPAGILFGLFGKKLSSPVLYEDIPEYIYNMSEYMEIIKGAWTEIHQERKQQKEINEGMKLKEELSTKTYNDTTLDQIRDILTKLDELSLSDQKEIVVELKKALNDYSQQKRTPTISDSQTVSEVLTPVKETPETIIQNVSNSLTSRKEEHELLSVMNAIESTNKEQPKAKRLKL